ncbi:unnamed protein product, partial [Schistosoma mattheei]
MDPYSPSHPTDQDMDLESNSPATPEQDANQNQLPPDQSLSDVVPLLFNSNTFDCAQDTNVLQSNHNKEGPHFEVSNEHNSSGERGCAPPFSVKSIEENVPKETKHDYRAHTRPSSVHKRSVQPHHRRSRSRSPKRGNKFEDKTSRRSRSHSRHRVRKHRSRSRSNERRRSRSRTPPRHSRVVERLPGPRSRSRSPAKSRRSVNEKRVSRFSDEPNFSYKAKERDSFVCGGHKDSDSVRWDVSKHVEEQSAPEAVITTEPTNSPTELNDAKHVPNVTVDIFPQSQPRSTVQPLTRWQNASCNNSAFLHRIPQMNYNPMRFPQNNYGLMGISTSTFPSGVIPYPSAPMPPNFMQPPPLIVPRLSTTMLPGTNSVFPGQCMQSVPSLPMVMSGPG